MTQDEFQDWFARDVEGGWPALARFIKAEPCDCGEDFCQGWSTRAAVSA